MGETNPNQKYLKLGGFLLLIVIANIIYTVINTGILFAGLIETFDFIGNMESYSWIHPNFETAVYITLFGELLGLVSEVFTVLFIVYVFQRKPSFLRFQQLAFILSLVYVILVGIIPNAMLDMYDEDFIRNIGTLIGSSIGVVIFTLYMCKSVRVRTYMGSDEYMSKAVFAFKNQPPLNTPPQV